MQQSSPRCRGCVAPTSVAWLEAPAGALAHCSAALLLGGLARGGAPAPAAMHQATCHCTPRYSALPPVGGAPPHSGPLPPSPPTAKLHNVTNALALRIHKAECMPCRCAGVQDGRGERRPSLADVVRSARIIACMHNAQRSHRSPTHARPAAHKAAALACIEALANSTCGHQKHMPQSPRRPLLCSPRLPAQRPAASCLCT